MIENDAEKEYVEDFLSIVLEKKINLDNPNPADILNLNFSIVMTQLIECEEFNILKYIISIYSIDINKIVTEIIKILKNNEDLSIYKITKWLYENDKNLFYEFINENLCHYDLIIVRDYQTMKFLFETDLSNDVYNQLNKNFIYNVTKQIFSNYIISLNLDVIKSKYVYSDFNYILLIIKFGLSENSYVYELYPNVELLYYDVLCKILMCKYSELKIITKFISHYKLDFQQMITYFECDVSITELIETNSYEKINWFFSTIPDYTKFITKKNYKSIFEKSCKTSNPEISKYIFNIICICDFQITKDDLKYILNNIIYENRWNKETSGNKIIYELINLDIEPPRGYSKLNEYYNNIKVYNN